jgi:hypothetical protein
MARPIQITGIDSHVFVEKRFFWKITAKSTVISGDMEPWVTHIKSPSISNIKYVYIYILI